MKIKLTFQRLTLLSAFLCSAFITSISQAQDYFIGEIRYVAFGYCPTDFFEANGSLLNVADYPALYSLLGVNFGGNGHTTFALPDLRGRVPVGAGVLPSTGTNYVLGSQGGQEAVTLTEAQMPIHSHSLFAKDRRAITTNPNGAALAESGTYNDTGNTYVTMHGASIGTAGGSQPHENRPPYLTLRACIAHSGIYPQQP